MRRIVQILAILALVAIVIATLLSGYYFPEYFLPHIGTRDDTTDSSVGVTLPIGVTSGFWGKRVLFLSQGTLQRDEELDVLLKEWQEINEGVGALIILPEFEIIEPVICDAEDNLQWLRTDIYGEYAVRGTVFLDYRCDIETTPIKLIHGHNMRNGSIFGHLPDYLTRESVTEMKNAILYLPEGAAIYEPYSVVSVSSDEEALPIDPLIQLDSLTSLTNDLLERSLVPDGEIHSLDTLVLNTCWYGESGEEHNLHCLVIYSKVGTEI